MKPAHIIVGVVAAFFCNTALSQNSEKEIDAIDNFKEQKVEVINPQPKYPLRFLKTLRDDIKRKAEQDTLDLSGQEFLFDYSDWFREQQQTGYLLPDHSQYYKLKSRYLIDTYTKNISSENTLDNIASFLPFIDQDIRALELTKLTPIKNDSLAPILIN